MYGIGCHSFAILFDDIDPELCLTDKLEFASSGDAQVYITNKLYEWFDNLKTVLFCPTGVVQSINNYEQEVKNGFINVLILFCFQNIVQLELNQVSNCQNILKHWVLKCTQVCKYYGQVKVFVTLS